MILWLAGIRYQLRHPLQMLFAVIGVALGVAVVVAIDMANSSAERAFLMSAEALNGRATHAVVAGSEGVPEVLYAQIRIQGKLRNSAPILEGFATPIDRPEMVLKIVGVDPFAESPFRSYSPGINGQIDFSQFLTKPGAGLMTLATAQTFGLKADESLMLNVGGTRYPVVLSGYLESKNKVTLKALENVIFLDLASAQEMLNQQGRLSRIDLIVPQDNAGQQALARLKALLPANVEVVPANSRSQSMVQMTRAFQLNLRALSLLALVVGGFLIYNTMTFSVLQRRPLLGSLRTMGVTRRELFALTLSEAVVIGVVGTMFGLLMGVLLANGLLGIVTRTINDLYFVLNIQQLVMTPVAMAKGVLLGIGATMVAAFMPAYEAAKTTPRTVLMRSEVERRRRVLLPWAVCGGIGLILVGIIGLIFPSKSVPASFLMMFLLIIGYALITPGALVWLLGSLQPVAKPLGILGKMAVRNLLGSLSRTGVATAALVIAVAATVGVGLMINSFRATVDQWLQSYLQADIYMTTATANFAPGRTPLGNELVQSVRSIPGVHRITKARHLTIESPKGSAELFVAEIPRASFQGYWFKDGNEDEIYRDFQTKDAVIVSEPYAYHRDLERGDTIYLRTDQGQKGFTISGIFTDYGSDRGRVTISRAVYRKYWKNDEADALGIYLEPGVGVDKVVQQIRLAASGRQDLQVFSNVALREASLETFDRTFAVTSVLRMLAVVVAFVGILNALMAMQIERAKELSVLRAGGLTPRQLWCLVIGETGLTGLVAGFLALPLGILQALVLILVINQRSFGWSMKVSIDPLVLVQAMALSVFAAVLAGLYPAWKMARTSPALAMRED